MNIETIKWIYQRSSTPIIIILFFWLLYNLFNIQSYDFETFKFFFKSILNLFLFVSLILLSLTHTSIEVFHSINDYFSKTKNEKIIRNFVIILYISIILSILFFVINFM